MALSPGFGTIVWQERYFMKARILAMSVLFTLSLITFAIFNAFGAEKKPPETVMIKLQGGKLPPVNFSHPIHVEKQKLECVTCHHKDKDPSVPEPCVSCHSVTEAKNNAPIAKDAFHAKCRTCHVGTTAQGIKAPTTCNECHKKVTASSEVR